MKPKSTITAQPYSFAGFQRTRRRNSSTMGTASSTISRPNSQVSVRFTRNSPSTPRCSRSRKRTNRRSHQQHRQHARQPGGQRQFQIPAERPAAVPRFEDGHGQPMQMADK
jgi:hypothetical protein